MPTKIVRLAGPAFTSSGMEAGLKFGAAGIKGGLEIPPVSVGTAPETLQAPPLAIASPNVVPVR